jgi:hypothetical protein
MMSYIEHLRNARERAVNEDMVVTPINAGEYDVINKDKTNRYKVIVEGKKVARCTCPQFERAGVCKHMVKVCMRSSIAIKVN